MVVDEVVNEHRDSPTSYTSYLLTLVALVNRISVGLKISLQAIVRRLLARAYASVRLEGSHVFSRTFDLTASCAVEPLPCKSSRSDIMSMGNRNRKSVYSPI
jgi:hypothetical protein